MKTILAFAFMFFVTSCLFAQPQIKTGVYSVSGAVIFSSSSTDLQAAGETKTTAFSLSPSLSYFAFDQIEFNISPSYTTSKSERTFSFPAPSSTSTFNSTGLGARLGLRYYFEMENIVPFVGAGGGLSWTKFSGSFFPSSSFSSPTKSYTAEGGIEYFINQVFAIEPSIQYRGTKSQSSSDNGFYISMGVKYFIF